MVGRGVLVALVAAVTSLTAGVVGAQQQVFVPGPVVSAPIAADAERYLVGLRVDPETGVVEVIAAEDGLGAGPWNQLPKGTNIDSSFTVVGSPRCLDCFGACPPWPRTVEVDLRVTAPVAAGYGVSDLVAGNLTGLSVGALPPGPLAVDDVITVSVTGDLVACSRFSVFFDLCDEAPLSPTGSCGVAEPVSFLPTGSGRTGAIQTWTVPVTGTYRIEAWGAQGASAEPGRQGGLGARMRGDFAFAAGQVLQILVGQQGTLNYCNGGGGGGSFVVDQASGTPLLVAGGGGGTRQSVYQDGCAGRVTAEGGTGSGSSPSHDCGVKGGGVGDGGVVSSYSWGSGGGGFYSGGQGEEASGLGYGGGAFVNGGTGGLGIGCGPSDGGFGGGGSGNGCCGGGGGGGYSGGDGGRIAGGGGSSNSGSNQDNAPGARSGDGLVTITPL